MIEARVKTKGYLIIYAIMLVFGIMSMGLAAISVVGAQYQSAKSNVYRQNAAYVSRACVTATVQELQDNPGFGGFTDEVIFDKISQGGGKGVCTTTVTADGDNTRIIDVTSRVLRTNSDPVPIRHKAAAVAVSGAAPAPEYSGVTIGHGGLWLPIVGHFSAEQVDVLGTLKIGSDHFTGYTGALVADETRVANIGCGSGSSWPQACTDEPITFRWLNHHGPVLGDICAPGQSSSVDLPGLNTGCTLPDMEMPAFDKKSFIENLDGPTIQAADMFDPDNYPNSCVERRAIPKPSWWPPDLPPLYELRGTTYEVPAGATIVGDVNINILPDNWNEYVTNEDCELRFNGDVYIKGGIRTIISGNRDGTLHIGVSDSVTEPGVTVVTNGPVTLEDATFPASTSGAKLHLVSFFSSDTACSNSDILPSATTDTCLTSQQAQDSANVSRDVYFIGIDASGAPLFRAFALEPEHGLDMEHVTLYAYYGGISSSCDWPKPISVGAIAAQAFGGADCSGINIWTITTVTDEESTFGAPPISGEFGLVDYYQKPL